MAVFVNMVCCYSKQFHTWLRATSAKIAALSTIHEAYVEDMAASIQALGLDLHDNIRRGFFLTTSSSLFE